MGPLERLIGSLYIYFFLLCPPETQREDAERQSAGLLAPSWAILGSILLHLRSISAHLGSILAHPGPPGPPLISSRYPPGPPRGGCPKKGPKDPLYIFEKHH